MALDIRRQLSGRQPDPAGDSGYVDHPARMGFFTDTSVCIGCKACEVACKEWNAIPDDPLNFTGMSYDNSTELGANRWRHVAFIEQPSRVGGDGQVAHPPAAQPDSQTSRAPVSLGMPVGRPDWKATAGAGPDGAGGQPAMDFRWLMSSDVCKHCTHAACLDVCPTGALMRTEFGTVVVQEDVCNGCGYCVPACPYGVIDQRKDDGRVWKCTMCYDRLGVGQEPACAKTCPTDSIQFGELDELRERAQHRVERLQADGYESARLYGHDPNDGVGGTGAFFLLLDQPEVYGLPPDPVVTTRDLGSMWRHAGVAAAALAAGVVAAAWGGRR